ncbi:TMEM175 family protein [Terriglobus aquaticus]|uniref:TMEM175 family protein n=1 Tax=Terriglobus aquaticus TaxID=940139 RepID=A0ABW9KNX7_9BACT|nr:TMEM175 family protein [Terriglobus aquaticus]
MQITHALVGKDGFRLRGEEMSRIDGFSDVVFGFALTLIVASLEVPKTFDELQDVLLGFLPFSICFLFLMTVWLSHFRFFRRFGLHDLATIVINAALLFTVLFYVYPLKFLFTLFTSQFYTEHTEHHPITHAYQFRQLTVTYALGFTAIYLFLFLLNWNGWRQRDALQLDELERLIVRGEMVDLGATACCGVAVAIVAMLIAPQHAMAACYLFGLIGIWKTITGSYFGKRIRVLQRQARPTGSLHSALPS